MSELIGGFDARIVTMFREYGFEIDKTKHGGYWYKYLDGDTVVMLIPKESLKIQAEFIYTSPSTRNYNMTGYTIINQCNLRRFLINLNDDYEC